MNLEGKRTYIVAALVFVAGGLKALGFIDDATYQTAMAVLLPSGLVALRLGIKGK